MDQFLLFLNDFHEQIKPLAIRPKKQNPRSESRMVDVPKVFYFKHIPLNVDKKSIKVFLHSKDTFSLEYSIFEPKTVHVTMAPVCGRWFRQKKTDRALASIQQFASTMGLHSDFHQFKPSPIHRLLKMFRPSFHLYADDPTSPSFSSGGILAVTGDKAPPLTSVENFIDDLLEILTDFPTFALVQLVFKPIGIPRKFRLDEEGQERQKTQLRFDIQQGQVQQRFTSSISTIMEEAGCFHFSPRVLIVETNPDTLKTKLNRISALFRSHGLKVRKYPSFWRRFRSFMAQCQSHKLASPIVLDGYSLMGFISPPKRQFASVGYSLVPHKEDYLLSSGIDRHSDPSAINVGIPIISGRTVDDPLLIRGQDFNRHMAVFGMTGEGKSRFIYGLIAEFYRQQVKFVIFDPKGEYLHPVRSFCQDVIYLKPGSQDLPWGINIFHIPRNASGDFLIPLEDHIQFIMSLLEHIFDESDALSPQMRRLLHLAIIQTVKEQGDFRRFLYWLDNPGQLGIKGSYLENTAAGILNRIEKLFFGNTGRCFTVSQTTFEIASLLDQNAIIDLSAFEVMEDRSGRQMFLEVIFQYLYYFARSFRPPFKEEGLPQNIFILDEIQKILTPQKSRFKASESIISKGPWTLRSYDISMIFIGTDPVIDQPILTNMGIFSIFYSKYDPYAIATLLGIPKTDYEQLRTLLKVNPDTRNCLISVNAQLSLLRTNEFPLDLSAPFDLSALQALPRQRQLQESYAKYAFDPIDEIISQN
ncbi:hypothetical protein CEE45_11520 [Candidatus Heimdallarchaeota archaeon B3_Heim]|nr:MAG: hypothetical protein CEE45_11520 [Candidatus Heimdallarchaeota archaeon B3_Heim]